MDDALDKALKTALDFEKKGFAIYTEASMNTKNPVVASTFKHLAEQEDWHVMEIEKYIKTQKIEMKGDTLKETRQFFSTTVNEFRDKTKMSRDDLKAHDIAVDLERNAYNFYKDELAKARTEELKRFFEFLMAQEKLHWELVNKAFEFIKFPEYFYGKEEQWIFEGG
jgi:rubrerythrin